ncbi:SPOR domain-containing protein [Rhodovulum steppense]|uniref:Sporulation related protein n=1 Tax=Rhodovulum steppense TaxID=540251 RepID=A0A4R1YVI6_9RHOB|nr:SPOR domain-containing protein [Rhodovulum steppense]TCM85152.1 sporulation related protein [Rhodovulum steppense]
MTGNRIGRLAMALGMAAIVAGCQDGSGPFAAFQERAADAEAVADAAGGDAIGQGDIEAPEIFSTAESGLWDGRPSLGGVWIAHPDVSSPQRVLIRNMANGKSVQGALFRREREMPGPKLQVSSDAAAALALLAGQPTELRVVALRRQRAPEAATTETTPAPGAAAAPRPAAAGSTPPAPRPARAATPPATGPAAAAPAAPPRAAAMAPADIAAPAPGTVAIPGEAQAAQTAAMPVVPRASTLDRPFIQVGIFTVEQNARDAAQTLGKAGIVPSIREQRRGGKTLWRIVIGPSVSREDQAALLEKVKGLGYTDAYYVSK